MKNFSSEFLIEHCFKPKPFYNPQIQPQTHSKTISPQRNFLKISPFSPSHSPSSVFPLPSPSLPFSLPSIPSSLCHDPDLPLIVLQLYSIKSHKLRQFSRMRNGHRRTESDNYYNGAHTCCLQFNLKSSEPSSNAIMMLLQRSGARASKVVNIDSLDSLSQDEKPESKMFFFGKRGAGTPTTSSCVFDDEYLSSIPEHRQGKKKNIRNSKNDDKGFEINAKFTKMVSASGSKSRLSVCFKSPSAKVQKLGHKKSNEYFTFSKQKPQCKGKEKEVKLVSKGKEKEKDKFKLKEKEKEKEKKIKSSKDLLHSWHKWA